MSNIVPLSKITILDINWLNDVPLEPAEMIGRTGTDKYKRRSVSKTLSELKQIMKYVHSKVVERGAFPASITRESVSAMFLAVEDIFDANARSPQTKWITVQKQFEKKKCFCNCE